MGIQDIFSSLLLAVSLCADCFAVTSCSSVTIRCVRLRKVLPIALAFGVIQTTLMFLGWLFGDFFVGAVERISGIIAFLMLLYVGGSMLLGAIKGTAEERNLNGLKNVLTGGVATSLDAFAVGISLSMNHCPGGKLLLDLGCVFAVTLLSVLAGILGGSKVGEKFGRPAEIAGGCVLVAIGLFILLS